MRKRFKKIYIEITNVCNLDCSFCPKTSRKPEFMPLDLFQKTILEAKELAHEITLHIMGEPLIHPQIEEIIKLAEENEVPINLTTNGIFTKKYSKLLLNKTIRRVNFSIHGIKSNFSKEEQEKYLKEIIDFTKLAQETRDELIIIYRLWNINDNSNKDVINIIENEFDVKLEEESKKISMKIKNNAYIHYDNSFEWPDPKKEVRSEKGYCHGLSTHIGVLSNGTIVPCCLDHNCNIPLGNINKNTIVEILSHRRAQDMKKGFSERKLVEDMCKKCTFIKRLERNRDKN